MTNFVDMNPKASTPASRVAGPVPLMAYLVIVSMFSNLKKSGTFKVYRRNRFRIFSKLNDTETYLLAIKVTGLSTVKRRAPVP